MPCINDGLEQMGEQLLSCLECSWFHPNIVIAETKFTRFVDFVNGTPVRKLKKIVLGALTGKIKSKRPKQMPGMSKFTSFDEYETWLDQWEREHS